MGFAAFTGSMGRITGSRDDGGGFVCAALCVEGMAGTRLGVSAAVISATLLLAYELTPGIHGGLAIQGAGLQRP